LVLWHIVVLRPIISARQGCRDAAYHATSAPAGRGRSSGTILI
jgi:hypothetical protein